MRQRGRKLIVACSRIGCLTVAVMMCAAVASRGDGLTGQLRTNFIEGGMPGCVAKAKQSVAGNEAFLDKAGISVERVPLYCRCMLEDAADKITPAEFSDLANGNIPDSLRRRTPDAEKRCIPLLKAP